jgi:hypothetical protein
MHVIVTRSTSVYPLLADKNVRKNEAGTQAPYFFSESRVAIFSFASSFRFLIKIGTHGIHNCLPDKRNPGRLSVKFTLAI